MQGRWSALVVVAVLALGGPAASNPPDEEAPAPSSTERAFAWLAANQAENGSWGRQYTVATTALACLAYLATQDEPFAGPHAPALHRGLEFLLSTQTEGMLPHQGHTWIHGQGFASLALSETYGRSQRCETKPDLDLDALKQTIERCVAAIAAHQSTSGGWWYHPNSPGQHEGSTTVCAVQALVSATNFGFEVDADVLNRGFEYLKRCQNPDGGFDYMEGPGTDSMKEGTAADVATLALMKRFDYDVMVSGVDFLEAIGPETISRERFPYYGHFYACMGLRLYGEEMGASEQVAPWIEKAHADVRSWQEEDGHWPLKGWMASSSGEDVPYATAFALLLLHVPDGRLSIFHRRPATE